MKIIGILAIAIFLSSCFSESQSKVETASLNSEKVWSLCGIAANPSNFDGKIIRLKTRLVFGTENPTFSDRKCADMAVVGFANKDTLDQIDKAAKTKGRNMFGTYFDIDVEVKFLNKPFTECCTKTPFQFEVQRLYEAQIVDEK